MLAVAAIYYIRFIVCLAAFIGAAALYGLVTIGRRGKDGNSKGGIGDGHPVSKLLAWVMTACFIAAAVTLFMLFQQAGKEIPPGCYNGVYDTNPCPDP
jgi:hypothetical protein